LKIVIDTNVLLSAQFFSGFTAEIYDYIWINHEIILSEWIITEFTRIAKLKIKVPENELNELINHIRNGVTILEPAGKKPVICRDTDDDNILWISESSKADILLTGDSDLLLLKTHGKTMILNPRQFREKFLEGK
jgi:putative PIN family toxin of toxin-antitoxin system